MTALPPAFLSGEPMARLRERSVRVMNGNTHRCERWVSHAVKFMCEDEAGSACCCALASNGELVPQDGADGALPCDYGLRIVLGKRFIVFEHLDRKTLPYFLCNEMKRVETAKLNVVTLRTGTHVANNAT